MQTIINGFDTDIFSKNFLKSYNVSKYLLVCDSAFEFLSVKSVFEDGGVPFVKFDSFSPNPVYEDVVKGVELFRGSECCAIVAVGGGSSIDVAKCIKLYSAMDPSECYIGQEFKDAGVPLAAVPSTAGTGSESTRHAVIYYKGEKQSISHDSIVPDVAFLEPDVLETLPLYQKKCTLLDALGQGIESWWSVNSNGESAVYSEKTVKMICENIDDYIFKNTPESREKIMEGANFSGRAINITQTTAAHAMSYKLSSLYGLPHGHAVALCLPKVWRYMLENTEKCSDPRGKEHLEKVFADIASAMGEKTAEEALEKFERIFEKLEMSYPDGKKDDIALLAASVNPVRLKNNPVALDSETLFKMYAQIVNI